MQNVPKIVSERLRVATPAAHHPDANVLTAFAEHSLAERERGAVLEHLARCGDCRDVIALALPPSEDLQKVFVPARRWLTWPALRWGFVTVGILAIAGVGFLQVQRRHDLQSKETARLEPYTTPQQSPAKAPSTSAPIEDNEESPAPSPSNTTSADKTRRTVVGNKLSAPAPPPPPPALRMFAPPVSSPAASGISGGVVAGVHSQFAHGPQPPAQWQQQTPRAQYGVLPPAATKQAAGQAVSLPAASETVAVEAQNTTVEVSGEAVNVDQLQGKAAQPPTAGYSFEGPVAKSKPALNSAGANAAPQAADAGAQAPAPQAPALNGRSFTQLAELSSTSTPRWTISPTGTLQRSFDQGKTWQDVDVNPNAGFGQNDNYVTSVQILPYPPPKEEARAKKKDLKSASAYALRAVAASGPEVWVGYSQGLLLHSVDVGAHWTYVWPKAGGANLTGDIATLEFADIQHGKVTTSTGEVWTTSDDGQTWQKQ